MLSACTQEAGKFTACAASVATEGWKGAATCVTGAITSLVGIIGNSLTIFNYNDVTQHFYGFMIINDYMDSFFAKGGTRINETRLTGDIAAIAKRLNIASDDYDSEFVKNGIRDSFSRTVITASRNVKFVEKMRAMLAN
jgi:hypothetical protein